MRLINIDSFELHEFVENELPLYAILSHTWGDEEVSLSDLADLSKARTKQGFQKIQLCCKETRDYGLSWAWVDTCCIDKTSSAELAEAINSMFRWYSEAVVCFAWLCDVSDLTDFEQPIREAPRWFSRGWTLQELIAPSTVIFFSRSWERLGTKDDLRVPISALTGIEGPVLLNLVSMDRIPVAKKMFWAARRTTTRAEDLAYCLLGIFDITMPLLYGEGKRAFTRLQEEILKRTDDHTIFLGGLLTKRKLGEYGVGMFSESPSDFDLQWECQKTEVPSSDIPPRLVGNQLHITLPITLIHSPRLAKAEIIGAGWVLDRDYSDGFLVQGALDCHLGDSQLTRYFLLATADDLHSPCLRLLPVPNSMQWVPLQDVQSWTKRKCIVASCEPREKLQPDLKFHDDFDRWRSLRLAEEHSGIASTRILVDLIFHNERFRTESVIVAWGLKGHSAICRVTDSMPGGENMHHLDLDSLYERGQDIIDEILTYDLDTDKISRRRNVNIRFSRNYESGSKLMVVVRRTDVLQVHIHA
ncbi:hypothetical protein JX266_000856 [Neoarthrinium moseri]|nr:hypothetical protein JX266_000856 [Neoarthrinium moseri]